jgi:hypothetical protein
LAKDQENARDLISKPKNSSCFGAPNICLMTQCAGLTTSSSPIPDSKSIAGIRRAAHHQQQSAIPFASAVRDFFGAKSQFPGSR